MVAQGARVAVAGRIARAGREPGPAPAANTAGAGAAPAPAQRGITTPHRHRTLDPRRTCTAGCGEPPQKLQQ